VTGSLSQEQQKLILCYPPALHCVNTEISSCCFRGFQLIDVAITLSWEYTGINGAASSERNQGH
jgi:hypothetical protein